MNTEKRLALYSNIPKTQHEALSCRETLMHSCLSLNAVLNYSSGCFNITYIYISNSRGLQREVFIHHSFFTNPFDTKKPTKKQKNICPSVVMCSYNIRPLVNLKI